MEADSIIIQTPETSVVGNENVPQGESPSITIEDVRSLIDRELASFCSGETYRKLQVAICDRILRLSLELDHISTIPHGINHVCNVTIAMLEDVPDAYPPLRIALENRYGEYWRVVSLLTGLCHDNGYAYLASLPTALPGRIFGRDHCAESARIFGEEIVPLIQDALPDLPAGWIEDIQDAIERHGDRFGKGEMLSEADNPLLVSLTIADKTDRVGKTRLHVLQRNPGFAACVGTIYHGIIPFVAESAQRVKDLEMREIRDASFKFMGAIPKVVSDGIRLIHQQLGFFPWDRDTELLNEGDPEKFIAFISGRYSTGTLTGNEQNILELFHEWFWHIHQIDEARWDPERGKLRVIMGYIWSTNEIPDDLKPLAIQYLALPRTPFGPFGSLYEDLMKFMNVRGIHLEQRDGIPVVRVDSRSASGDKVAARIASGLNGILIGGNPIKVKIRRDRSRDPFFMKLTLFSLFFTSDFVYPRHDLL